MRPDPPQKDLGTSAGRSRCTSGRVGVWPRALVALVASGGILAVAACQDGLFGPKGASFQVQLDVRAVPPAVSAALELVELTTHQGAVQQNDSLTWDAVAQGTPFTVELSHAGDVRFDVSALAGTLRPEGGVALLHGSTQTKVEDGFEVYVYLEDMTPSLEFSSDEAPCGTDLNLVMRRRATVRICNGGGGVLTWTGGGGSVVDPQANTCPPDRPVCIALEPASGQVPPGGDAVVELRSLGGVSGVDTLDVEFEEIYEGLVLDTVTASVMVEVPAISIGVVTDPADTQQPPGPDLEVGTGLPVSYTVTNGSVFPFDHVVVTEEDALPTTEGADTVFELARLEPGEVFDTTVIRPVASGEQARQSTAQGTFDAGDVVRESVTHYYVGLVPGVDVETLTNGLEDDTFPGPTVAAGSDVEIEYRIRNTGELPLGPLTLTDTAGAMVPVTCAGQSGLPSTLAAGDAALCTLHLIAQPGQFSQQYTVTGTTPAGRLVADADSSHHVVPQPPFVEDAGISVQMLTNGVDADAPPGPAIEVGDAVTWEYRVTNVGNVPLTGVDVNDDHLGLVCSHGSGTLDPGDGFTCSAQGSAAEGQYAALATAEGTSPTGQVARDTDPSHYLGVAPGIDLETLTNGVEDDAFPGPKISAGSDVVIEYRIRNVGGVPLGTLTLTDGAGAAVPATCSGEDGLPPTLAAGEEILCKLPLVAEPGQFAQQYTVTGTSPAGRLVADADSSYFVVEEPSPVRIEVRVNGVRADEPPGPSVTVGLPVTWSYTVINTLGEPVTNVVVTDSVQGEVCEATSVEAGGTMTCEASGVSELGQYASVATVTAQTQAEPAQASERTYYFGVEPGEWTEGIGRAPKSIR